MVNLSSGMAAIALSIVFLASPSALASTHLMLSDMGGVGKESNTDAITSLSVVKLDHPYCGEQNGWHIHNTSGRKIRAIVEIHKSTGAYDDVSTTVDRRSTKLVICYVNSLQNFSSTIRVKSAVFN